MYNYIATESYLEVDQIALEANVLSNMFNSLRTIFPNIVNKVKAKLGEVDEELKLLEQEGIQLTTRDKQIFNKLKKVNYLDISQIAIVVPEGFESKYLNYGVYIEETLNNLNKLKNEVLVPYKLYLTTFIANRDAKISTVDKTLEYDKLSLARKDSNDTNESFFKIGSVQSKQRLGTVVTRNADIILLNNKVEILENKLKVVNVSDVKNTSKECIVLLDTIIKMLGEKKFSNVSPETAKNLAKGAFEVAKEVEYFAVSYYRVKTYIAAVQATIDRVEEYLKR